MRKAVVSAAFGPMHERMSGYSYHTFRRYAKNVGADFVPITERKFPERKPHLEKFQIRDILQDYDVVLWVDCDALISRHACSVFDHVPPGHFAAVDEGVHGTLIDVPRELRAVSDAAGLPFPEKRPFIYFNSGVFVAWKEHGRLFDNMPDRIPTEHGINDQTLLNVRVALSGTPFTALAKTWNMIWVPPGFELSHIVHFAGRLKNDGMIEDMAQKALTI